jgi:hypothetical protein
MWTAAAARTAATPGARAVAWLVAVPPWDGATLTVILNVWLVWAASFLSLQQ